MAHINPNLERSVQYIHHRGEMSAFDAVAPQQQPCCHRRKSKVLGWFSWVQCIFGWVEECVCPEQTVSIGMYSTCMYWFWFPAHYIPIFLLWHRYFIYVYERFWGRFVGIRVVAVGVSTHQYRNLFFFFGFPTDWFFSVIDTGTGP